MSLNRLTRAEEASFTSWFLLALKHRPEDFLADTYKITDRQTGIAVWIANGRWSVKVYAPVETARFRWLFKRRIWRAMKPWRIGVRNNVAERVRRAYAGTPTVITNGSRG